MQGWKEKRQQGIDLCKLLEKNKKLSHPISNMYTEEKLKCLKSFFSLNCFLLKSLLVTFADGNCEINSVNNEAAEQNRFT